MIIITFCNFIIITTIIYFYYYLMYFSMKVWWKEDNNLRNLINQASAFCSWILSARENWWVKSWKTYSSPRILINEQIAHLSRPWSNGWVALSFLFCSFVPLWWHLLLLHFYLPQTPKPIHFLKAYDNSYSKMNKEHKYKDKDEYKDNDKDKDA